MTANKSELRGLASDLKTIVEYLSELGVEDIPVDLDSALEFLTSTSGRKGSDRVHGSEIDALVSTLRQEESNEDDQEPVNTPRRDLLGDTRISDAANISRREASYSSKPKVKRDMTTPVSKVADSFFEEQLPESNETLADIHADISPDCQRCELCENRTQVVNSVGAENADLMIVGEAPGRDEDEKGEPFVGRAGKLLTKILEAIGFKREDVFIGNINRCRPPQNRQPTLEESAVCKPFLLREIAAVRPKVIVVLGNTATKNLLSTTTGITKLRGKFAEYYGVKVMPTFHPAYLLRDPRKKREVWEDMKTVRDYLDSTGD